MQDGSNSPIRNTTKAMRDDPAESAMFLLSALDGSGAIEAQEAAGQRQLVNSDRLPVDTQGTDADFTAVGFTFGELDPGDPLFRPATLPEGWRREASDHAMWSYLVDQHGRKRVSVFYNAAFYDRKAHMHMQTPTSYLRSALYDDTVPVLDDEWLTLAIACETLEAIAAAEDKQAEKAEGYIGDGRGDAEFWRGRVAEYRAEAAKARGLALHLQLPGGVS